MNEHWMYVVTKGSGDKQHISGIYATLEAAKAANTEGGEWRMDEPDECRPGVVGQGDRRARTSRWRIDDASG
jgi:hypothetical protein